MERLEERQVFDVPLLRPLPRARDRGIALGELADRKHVCSDRLRGRAFSDLFTEATVATGGGRYVQVADARRTVRRLDLASARRDEPRHLGDRLLKARRARVVAVGSDEA